ncbi:MAG: ankyrin repeat domain-containing protein [Deltaproteobacteria bacterium]|nr:ankyrin repeat domain-containing protein [Deltaproteobacteria bacterium]
MCRVTFLTTTILGLVITMSPMAGAESHEIFDAVSDGDVERVRDLLALDPALRELRDENGRAPFHWAIMKSQQDLWPLLETSELLHSPDSMGLTPIFMAITNRGSAAVDWLIEQGADIQAAKPGDGQAPLHWAAELGRTEAVRSLLAAEAKVEAKNRVNSTPLLVAAKLGRTECLSLLLEAGANPNQKNLVGLTPLMIAALRDYREIITALLEAGADPNLRDGRGKTALDYAQEKEYVEVVKILRGD